jgi:hypothetical protein
LTIELLVHRPGNVLIPLDKDKSLVHTRALDVKQVRAFESKQGAGSTAFIGWLTLCQLVIGRMLTRSKFVLAVRVTEHGIHPTFHDVVGVYLNTLLIPATIGPEDAMVESISTTKTVVQGLSHSRLPSNKVKSEVMFVYHNADRVDAIELSTGKAFLQRADQLQLTSASSRFDPVVHCYSALGSGAHLKMEYRSSLFIQEPMEAMSRSINAALNDIVSCGNQIPCADISCLSPFDRARTIEWSTPYPLPESYYINSWHQQPIKCRKQWRYARLVICYLIVNS